MSDINNNVDLNTDLNTKLNTNGVPMEAPEASIYAQNTFAESALDDINVLDAIKEDKLTLAAEVEENFVEVKAGDWNLANAAKLFNLDAFIAKGYKATKDSLWSFNQTTLVSHVVLNKVIVRFNDDFTDVVEGTKSRSMAENPNASDTYDKLPLGQDNHSPTATGNGMVIGYNADGSLNFDRAVVSVDFSYAEKDRKLTFAAEDVLAGICGDQEFEYSAEDVALAHQILNKEVNYKTLGKEVAGRFLTLTKWFEMKLNTGFSFDQKDFGIKNVKQEVDAVIAVNQYIRACVVKQLAAIAKEVGVAPGQYCEFIFAGLSYSAKVKKNDNYKEPSLFANFTFNRTTNLPGGLVVLCQPVGYSSYKTSTKLNVPSGRAARLGLKATPAKAVAVEWTTPVTHVTKVDLEFKGFDATTSTAQAVDLDLDLTNLGEDAPATSTPAASLLGQAQTNFVNVDEDDEYNTVN